MDSPKHRGIGILLAVLGGTFGLHRLYLHDHRAWLYILLCWTGMPTLIGLLEAFDMPRRVRLYESERAEAAAERLRWNLKSRECR